MFLNLIPKNLTQLNSVDLQFSCYFISDENESYEEDKIKEDNERKENEVCELLQILCAVRRNCSCNVFFASLI